MHELMVMENEMLLDQSSAKIELPLKTRNWAKKSSQSGLGESIGLYANVTWKLPNSPPSVLETNSNHLTSRSW